MPQFLKGVTLENREGDELPAEEHLKGKIIGLYFSASWCPPCRAFTPKLKEFFEEIKKTHPEFEIIFVSRDRNSSDLVTYFKEHQGEWTYIPFGSDKIMSLMQKYEVKTIPAMRIVNDQGEVIVQDARTEIQNKGENVEGLWAEWMALIK
ncbi:protein-disulfide reductase [Caenorhabditis elegans]|uniref:protein-disulfide reductase n=1 Tax=Caenorhabditis elegans TaxID=6239 RepID=Q9N3H9_CAEEL|nr:Thioredoxin domain-containing protein [Caenorhabditis elegans]CCD62413.1 Thioredoxin domain-containing protein [Caenorhabditis elegans]|eukprot:NP_494757.1 Uncharacterized protein CELE_Y52E8A.3 [Caenorhabditis elegans]